MKLSEAAVVAIKENMKLRNRLTFILDCHPDTLTRWVRENEEDGNLTKVTAIQIIHEESGLAQSEILTPESNAA